MKIRVGGQWHPLELGQIERILPDPGVTPVPRAPEGVVGLLSYGGRAVPVLAPRTGSRKGCFAVLLRGPDGALKGVLAEEIAGELGSEEELH